MTAYADVETSIKALQSGAYDYLRKPLYPQELSAALDRCFEKIDLVSKSQAAISALEAERKIRGRRQPHVCGEQCAGTRALRRKIKQAEKQQCKEDDFGGL